MNTNELKEFSKAGFEVERDENGRLYMKRFHELFGPSNLDLTSVEALAALRLAGKSLHLLQERWGSKHGLSEGRMGVLFRLFRCGDMPLGEMAEDLATTPRNMTGLVDHLERDGLVERVPDAADRRSVRARLTAAGRERIEGVWKEGFANQIDLVEGMTKEELAQLRHLCLLLVENARKELGEMIEPQSITTGLSRQRIILATAGTMLALLLAALDQTIVGTAIPRIVAELNGLDRLAWVTTAYLVTSTTMTPIAGKLGDLFGRKPFLLAGMVGFVAASALCGLSQDMTQLIVARGVQGVFGGVLFATVFTIIGDLFPPSQRGRLAGLFGAVFGLSSIIGPTTGGFITDHWSWRWVFYVNVPVGVIAVLVVLAGLPYVRSKASWRDIDFWGAITLAAGIVPLLIALTITRDHAWTSPQVTGLLAFAALMLGTFVLVESRVEHPIVPLHLFKNPTFSVSMIVGFLTAFGMFGSILFTPLVFQGVLGVSATNSGALITPMMFGLLGASTITGFAMRRIRYYRFLGTLGVTIMIVGMWLLSQITPSVPQWRVVMDLIIVGAGIGVTFPLYLTAVQVALPREYMGVASSQIQFWRNLGGTVGSAILGAILSNRLPGYINDRITALHLPPGAPQTLPATGANTILDPVLLAKLPPAFVSVIRLALAETLHDIYLFAAAILIVALISTVFLREVSLTGSRAGTGFEAPPFEEAAEEQAAEEPAAATA